jgi:hypothetical protein
MPMTDEHRRTYLQRAGVTLQQIEETVGKLPIHEGTVQAQGLSSADVERARSSIRQVLADAAIIAAKYSTAAAGAPGGTAPGPDEVAADRRHLEELFAEEYKLITPFGEEQTRAQVIDAMLQGLIHYDGMGRAGFEAKNQTLHAYGGTAVVIGDYQMRASGRAKHVETGEAVEQDLSGSYRITNTYVFRNNRWQASASHMTQVPAEHKLTLSPDA